MNERSLRDGLATTWLGRTMFYADSVDSTNLWAARSSGTNPQVEGAVFVAARQTRGRGSGGSRWYSDDTDGLWFSIVLREPVRVQPLSFLPGVALVDLLRQEIGVDAHLKWPNDVLVGDRKLAGILVESQQQSDASTAWIVGIGLNVNQVAFPPELADTAVSLRLLTGRPFRRQSLLQRLLQQIERIYRTDVDVVQLWRTRTRMIGARVRATRRGVPSWVHVVGVNDAGHLQVIAADGSQQTWVSSTDLDLGREFGE